MRALRQLAGEIRMLLRARRNRTDLLRALVRRPQLLAATGAYELGLGLSARVDQRLKTLASLKAASMVGCAYCLDIGSALARVDGATERQLRDLHRHEQSSAFDDDERLVLDLAVAMSGTPVSISPDLRSRLDARFSVAELAELASLLAWENHRARLNEALDVRPSGFSDGQTCALPSTSASSNGADLPATVG